MKSCLKTVLTMDPIVIQWNCRSANSKKSDLFYLINTHKPYIISLQETWLRPNHPFKIRGYSSVREDRSDGYAGVALYIHESLSFTHIPTPHQNSDFSIILAKFLAFVLFLYTYLILLL